MPMAYRLFFVSLVYVYACASTVETDFSPNPATTSTPTSNGNQMTGGSSGDGSGGGTPSTTGGAGGTLPGAVAATYYVSPSGDDNALGTSPNFAWRTLAKVSAGTYVAGTTIELAGGQTYSGQINLSNLDGNASAPITITSDAAGVAAINSPDSPGLLLTNSRGVVVRGLQVVGDGNNASDGVLIINNLPAGNQKAYLRVQNVEVTGYGNCGVNIQGGQSGFTDVDLSGISSHDNKKCGIQTLNTASIRIVHANVRIHHSTVFNIPGDPGATSHTGDGIVLGNVDGGLMQYNIVHDCASNNGSTGGGAVGIWTWQSNSVVIQYNEVYRISSGLHLADGDAYDLDGGVTNSIVQYNYSHNNDGAAVLLCTFNGSNPTKNNIVRYNVSENDARTHFGAITLYENNGSPLSDLQIYNNTLYVSNVNAPLIYGVGGDNVSFYNNILFASGSDGQSNPAYLAVLDTPATFLGNDYWVANSAYWGIYIGSSHYTDLASFQAAGYEKQGSTPTGLSVDPQLNNPSNGGTLGNPNNLATLTAYQLQANSSLRDAGLDANVLTGVMPGWRDFYNGAIGAGAACDIGAHELDGPQLPTGVSGNLLANGGFENGTAMWSSFHDVPTVSTSVFRSGTQALQFDGTTPFTDLYQLVAGLGAGAYEATAWFYGDGTDVPYLSAFGTNISSHVPLSTAYDANVTGAGWHQLIADFDLSGVGAESGTNAYLYSPATVNQGVVWDDLRLVSLPGPEAVNGMNLVADSSFEDGSSAWMRVATGGNVVGTTSARSGVDALNLGGSAAANYQQHMGALGAGVYEVTAWLYGSGTLPTLSIYDANSNRLAYVNGAVGTGWHPIQLNFSLSGAAPQDAVTLEIASAASANANDLLVDDVALVQR